MIISISKKKKKKLSLFQRYNEHENSLFEIPLLSLWPIEFLKLCKYNFANSDLIIKKTTILLKRLESKHVYCTFHSSNKIKGANKVIPYKVCIIKLFYCFKSFVFNYDDHIEVKGKIKK